MISPTCFYFLVECMLCIKFAQWMLSISFKYVWTYVLHRDTQLLNLLMVGFLRFYQCFSPIFNTTRRPGFCFEQSSRHFNLFALWMYGPLINGPLTYECMLFLRGYLTKFKNRFPLCLQSFLCFTFLWLNILIICSRFCFIKAANRM